MQITLRSFWIKMLSRIKYLIAPLIFVAIFGALYETGSLNIFYVRSMCRPIYVPIISWALVLVYSVFIRLTFPKKSYDAAGTIRWAVILGFAVSIYSALFSLVVSLVRDHSFLSAYYFYYVIAVLAILTLVLSFASAIILNRIRGDRRGAVAYKYALLMPAFLLPFYLAVSYAGVIGKMIFVLLIGAYFIPYIFIKTTVLSSVANALGKAARFIVKNDKNFIIFIFLLSFVFRAAFAVNIVHKTEATEKDSFVLASDDGDTYDRVAKEILISFSENKRPTATIWGGTWDEGYSYILAFIYKVFGRDFYAVVLLQALWGSLIPVFVFLTGRLLFSRAVGILAAFALSIKGSIIFFSIVMNHESVWLPMAIILIYILTKVYKTIGSPYKQIFLAGLVAGLICVFRGLFVHFIVFTSVWMLIFWNNKSFKQRIKLVALFCIASMMLISAVSFISGCPFSKGSPDRFQILWVSSHFCDQFYGIGNERLVEIGINPMADPVGSALNIVRHPSLFLKVALSIYPMRIYGFFESYQFGFFDPLYLVNAAKCANDFMPTLEFYFTVFFMYGFIRCIKRSYILKSPIFTIIAFNILVSTIIFSHLQIRQRAMSIPFVYLIGSYGLVLILRRLDILKGDDGSK